MSDVESYRESDELISRIRDMMVRASTCLSPSWGSTCPECGEGTLNYGGLLNLVCPICGYQAPGGAFT